MSQYREPLYPRSAARPKAPAAAPRVASPAAPERMDAPPRRPPPRASRAQMARAVALIGCGLAAAAAPRLSEAHIVAEALHAFEARAR
jgi:hypothetical protein